MLNKTLKSIADLNNPYSPASRMRRRRFELFRQLLAGIGGTPRVIDLGGTPAFWRRMPKVQVQVTLVNLPDAKLNDLPECCTAMVGDATDLSQFPDNAFDIVFSNSVIEHVGDWSAQQRMAAEVRRLAPRYFIQTPNYYFPIEPHYHAIGVQWLPDSLKRQWLRANGKRYDDAALHRIRLLTEKEMRRLFPDARIWHERVAGLTKSFIAYR